MEEVEDTTEEMEADSEEAAEHEAGATITAPATRIAARQLFERTWLITSTLSDQRSKRVTIL